MSLAAMDVRTLVASTSYLVAATLFLLGLQRMASPVTARSGIRWAGMGMVIATAATFLLPDLHNLALIVTALVLGTVLAWVSGKKVAITDMPQMVALYNGMGGGSAAAIGAVELLRFSALAPGVAAAVAASSAAVGPEGVSPASVGWPSMVVLVLGVVGAAIGAVLVIDPAIAAREIAFCLADQAFDHPQIAGIGADALLLRGAAGGQKKHRKKHQAFHRRDSQSMTRMPQLYRAAPAMPYHPR